MRESGRGPQWGPFTTVNDAAKGHRTARIDHPSPSRSAVVERSREFAEFLAAEAGVGADATQPARGNISTGMDWDRHGLGPWCPDRRGGACCGDSRVLGRGRSRRVREPGPPGHRAATALAASGDFDGERQLVWGSELGHEADRGLPEVGDGFFGWAPRPATWPVTARGQRRAWEPRHRTQHSRLVRSRRVRRRRMDR